MNLLLDTQVLLWWLSGDRRLSQPTRDVIADATMVYVSAATAWEIAIKAALGKLVFRGNLEDQLRLNNFRPLPISIAHALGVGRLPPHHGDPFDRMLAAQAQAESLTLLTADRRLEAYGIDLMLV